VPPARQLAHPGRVEAAHVQPRPRVRGEPARRLVPGSDQQADRVAREPARDEPQGVRALVVEPLHVVDQADQAGAAGRLGEDRQYRQRDEERIVAGGRPEPQRAAQRGRLLVGQAGELPEYRTQQLVHAAPGEPGLELHSGRTQYRQPTGRAGRVLQQRGLADPRRPGQQEDAALPGPHLVERPGDPQALRVAPDQHGGQGNGRPRSFGCGGSVASSGTHAGMELT